MRRTTGNPFVAAPSEVNGRMYLGDENALIALHKMPTRMGSPAEIEASKAWLRSQGLTGLFEEPLHGAVHPGATTGATWPEV